MSIIALNFCVFFNCLVNSPMSHAVVANMKTMVTTCLSFVVFNQPVVPLGVAGMALNFAGGSWYYYVKYRLLGEKDKGFPDEDGEHATAKPNSRI